MLKYVPKGEAQFGKPLCHFFIFHRINLVHSGSIFGTMWDIFRAVPFEKKRFYHSENEVENLATFCTYFSNQVTHLWKSGSAGNWPVFRCIIRPGSRLDCCSWCCNLSCVIYYYYSNVLLLYRLIDDVCFNSEGSLSLFDSLKVHLVKPWTY